MTQSLGAGSEKQPRRGMGICFAYPGSHWHIYFELFYNRALLPGPPVPKKVGEDVAKEPDLVGEFQIWEWPS